MKFTNAPPCEEPQYCVFFMQPEPVPPVPRFTRNGDRIMGNPWCCQTCGRRWNEPAPSPQSQAQAIPELMNH